MVSIILGRLMYKYIFLRMGGNAILLLHCLITTVQTLAPNYIKIAALVSGIFWLHFYRRRK